MREISKECLGNGWVNLSDMPFGEGPFGGASVVPFRLSRPVEKHKNNGNPFFRRVRTYVRKEDYGRVRMIIIYTIRTRKQVSHTSSKVTLTFVPGL